MEPQTAPSVRRPRLRSIVLTILALTIVLVGASALYLNARLDPGTRVVGISNVAVQDDLFAPAAIEMLAGTTVSWLWEDIEEHNVVSDDFESPVQTEGAFSHTFDQPGTYGYECTLHFFKRGEVVVKD